MDNAMLWWSLDDVPGKHTVSSLLKALERFCIRFPTELPTIIACSGEGYSALSWAITGEYHLERPTFLISEILVNMEIGHDIVVVYDKRVFANSWYIGGKALQREIQT